jgi:hypothetical protein
MGLSFGDGMKSINLDSQSSDDESNHVYYDLPELLNASS